MFKTKPESSKVESISKWSDLKSATSDNKNFQGLSDAVARHLEIYLDAHEGSLPVGQLYDCVLGELEKPLITLVLDRLRGNQIRTAEVLGINRNTLRKKIRLYDIVVRRRSKNEKSK